MDPLHFCRVKVAARRIAARPFSLIQKSGIAAAAAAAAATAAAAAAAAAAAHQKIFFIKNFFSSKNFFHQKFFFIKIFFSSLPPPMPPTPPPLWSGIAVRTATGLDACFTYDARVPDSCVMWPDCRCRRTITYFCFTHFRCGRDTGSMGDPAQTTANFSPYFGESISSFSSG